MKGVYQQAFNGQFSAWESVNRGFLPVLHTTTTTTTINREKKGTTHEIFL